MRLDTRPRPRDCLDCGALVFVANLDEPAVCEDCAAARRHDEERRARPDPQVGARFVVRDAGANLGELMAVTRHASASVAARYVRPAEAARNRASRLVAERLG